MLDRRISFHDGEGNKKAENMTGCISTESILITVESNWIQTLFGLSGLSRLSGLSGLSRLFGFWVERNYPDEPNEPDQLNKVTAQVFRLKAEGYKYLARHEPSHQHLLGFYDLGFKQR